jgi:hypothetical protein
MTNEIWRVWFPLVRGSNRPGRPESATARPDTGTTRAFAVRSEFVVLQ